MLASLGTVVGLVILARLVTMVRSSGERPRGRLDVAVFLGAEILTGVLLLLLWTS